VDLGGIIVIDFIDMVLESNRDLVLRRLLECLGRDRTRHQVAEVTSLGLVQMTRKRVGEGLLESFSEICPECGGSGVILTIDPVAAKRRRSRPGPRSRRPTVTPMPEPASRHASVGALPRRVLRPTSAPKDGAPTASAPKDDTGPAGGLRRHRCRR